MKDARKQGRELLGRTIGETPTYTHTQHSFWRFLTSFIGALIFVAALILFVYLLTIGR